MTAARSDLVATNGLLTISHGEFARVRELIYRRFGIHLSEQKKTLVQGRLNKHLRSKGYRAFGDYLDDLERDGSVERLLSLVDCISTNHSFFFREAGHFQYLQETVFPQLQRDGVAPTDLAIWCAGAAGGQEPYTLAMVLREYFGDSVTWRRPAILATDISVSALEQAKAATYPAEVVKATPVRYRKYFVNDGSGGVRVTDDIRRMILFKRLNLIQPRFPFKGKFHVVFCRNVMIYFDTPTKMELAARFSRYTTPNGYLIIGHSESLGREPAGYRYVQPTVYRRYREGDGSLSGTKDRAVGAKHTENEHAR